MRTSVIALCLLAVTTGCTAPAGSGSGTATPTADTPDFSCSSYEPVAGLELSVSDETDIHLTVREAESGTTVVDQAVSGLDYIVYHGSDGTFEPQTNYRVTIRTAGSVRWNRTITSTQRYELTVERNGTVTVEAVVVEDTPTPCAG